jgi:penicillin-binding protein 1A
MRQPGSSFKPVGYLAALEKGFTPYDLVVDEPITEGRYHPKNFGGKYYGELTLLEALTYSLNTVSVRLTKAIGVDAVISVARRMGITADLEPSLALSLGSSEISMVEMVQAYAVIASGGHTVKAFGVNEIKTKDGKSLYKHKQEPAVRVFRSSDISALVEMMTSVVQHGTGAAAASPFFVAGKTGTSSDYRDAWFDGFTNDYIASVWFGNDDNTSMKSVTGGGLAAGTWKRIIVAAKQDKSPSKYNLEKSYNMGDEFSDLIGRIMSEDRPTLENEAAANNGLFPDGSLRPTFRPDKLGDKVGYGRLND